MPEHRANPRRSSALIGGDEISARVVLVGRTGQDARLRLDPAVELIRVRTGFDAIGELANPVGDVPGRTVVIVGSGSDIDERNGGDDAFVSATRRVIPDAVVLRASEAGANSHMPGAYDNVVPTSASTDELRELIHGPADIAAPTPEPSMPKPVSSPEPASDSDQSPTHSLNGTHAHAATEALVAPDTDTVGPASPSLGTPIFGDDDLDEEELALLREPEPEAGPPQTDPLGSAASGSTLAASDDAQSRTSPSSVGHADRHEPPQIDTEMKPLDPSRFGGDGDDVLVAAALGGRNILEPALGLIRARVGRSDVEFVEHIDDENTALPGDDASGVAVVWSGVRYGSLRIAGIDAAMIATGADDASGRLAYHARWLAMWLALAEQHRRLRVEAYTDSVSGAWNRRYFDRFLEAALPHARQRRYKLTVLVFDLDNFKSFNDRFGHQAGDMILSEVVRLLRSMTRPTDRICRIGGDEFAVVFYEPDGPRDTHSDHPQAFEMVAERFQKVVEDQRFPKLGIEAPGELTISGGLATFPWDGQTPAELLHRADQLALASKAAGKNQITLGQPDHE